MFAVKSQGAVEVIVPNVPLKGEYVEELRETVQYCLADGIPMLVLNLHDVPLLDSAGLESLLDIRDLVEKRGGTVKLASPPPLTQDILRVTGLGQQFEVFADEKSAVRSYIQ
jgi:anti-sigma B factor antagonist